MEQIFIHLAIILSVAFVISYIARAFKQPIIIGYIIAGIIISPFLIKYGFSKDIISVLSEFGIAFLLFTVGLHLNPKVVKEIGTVSLLVGFGQMILTFGLGFLASTLILGFNSITSSYIGVGLAFSSTIIVMKLLSDKGQLGSLHGKISIGILMIQDLVAAAALMYISSVSGSINFGSFALRGFLSGAGLVVVLFLAGFFIIPRITRSIARSQELLFLFSITWAFLVAGLFSYFGFSIEIGALLAGVILSISPYSIEISSKIRPLRDFFIIIFFIILGFSFSAANLGTILVNALVLSLIALIFKPLILMILMAFFGFTNRTNFMVGTSLAQISEFSLVVLALGVSVGQVSPEILSTMTLTGIITITFSTYMFIYSQSFYDKVSGFASIFEKKKLRKERKISKNYDVILFGYNRIGFSLLKSFKEIKKKYLVVDFNPDVVRDLEKLRIPVLYGDAYDSELLAELPLNSAQIIISTIPDPEISILLIEIVKAVNPKAIIIVRAHSIEQALEFYKKGATYVLTPHFLGGEYLAEMLRNLKTDGKGYDDEREKHMKMLIDRIKAGHDHPDVEKN